MNFSFCTQLTKRNGCDPKSITLKAKPLKAKPATTANKSTTQKEDQKETSLLKVQH